MAANSSIEWKKLRRLWFANWALSRNGDTFVLSPGEPAAAVLVAT
jgi:hypothetical protein